MSCALCEGWTDGTKATRALAPIYCNLCVFFIREMAGRSAIGVLYRRASRLSRRSGQQPSQSAKVPLKYFNHRILRGDVQLIQLHSYLWYCVTKIANRGKPLAKNCNFYPPLKTGPRALIYYYVMHSSDHVYNLCASLEVYR